MGKKGKKGKKDEKPPDEVNEYETMDLEMLRYMNAVSER